MDTQHIVKTWIQGMFHSKVSIYIKFCVKIVGWVLHIIDFILFYGCCKMLLFQPILISTFAQTTARARYSSINLWFLIYTLLSRFGLRQVTLTLLISLLYLLLTLTVPKSIKSWSRAMFYSKIRFSVEYCIGMKWLIF